MSLVTPAPLRLVCEIYTNPRIAVTPGKCSCCLTVLAGLRMWQQFARRVWLRVLQHFAGPVRGSRSRRCSRGSGANWRGAGARTPVEPEASSRAVVARRCGREGGGRGGVDFTGRLRIGQVRGWTMFSYCVLVVCSRCVRARFYRVGSAGVCGVGGGGGGVAVFVVVVVVVGGSCGRFLC